MRAGVEHHPCHHAVGQRDGRRRLPRQAAAPAPRSTPTVETGPGRGHRRASSSTSASSHIAEAAKNGVTRSRRAMRTSTRPRACSSTSIWTSSRPQRPELQADVAHAVPAVVDLERRGDAGAAQPLDDAGQQLFTRQPLLRPEAERLAARRQERQHVEAWCHAGAGIEWSCDSSNSGDVSTPRSRPRARASGWRMCSHAIRPRVISSRHPRRAAGSGAIVADVRSHGVPQAAGDGGGDAAQAGDDARRAEASAVRRAEQQPDHQQHHRG